jgi:hypothetical protein
MLAAVAVVSAASLAALAAVSTASLAALAVTAVGSVDVAVLDFLPGSFADLDDLDRVSGLLALEVFLETRDNIAPAVEVDKRFSGVGGIDELSIVIDELVVEGYDTILLNDHCCSFRDRARVLVSV